MFTRILVAYDDGNASRRALTRAIELAQDTPADIFLVSVYTENDIESWRLRGFRYPADASAMFKPGTKEYSVAEDTYRQSFQATAVDHVRQAGLPVHCEMRKGKPASAIIEYAKEIGADLIVTGTHNRGASARLVLGSVADAMIHNAPCPVMVVRE